MAFEVTFTLRDSFGRSTTRRMTNTRPLLADAETDVTAMTGYLEALSGCSVVKTAIAQVATFGTSPAAGSNENASLTIHARLDNGKLAPIHIPAVETTLVNSDGTLKLAETAVTNLETALGSGGHWTISEGNTVTDFVSGELDS